MCSAITQNVFFHHTITFPFYYTAVAPYTETFPEVSDYTKRLWGDTNNSYRPITPIINLYSTLIIEVP